MSGFKFENRIEQKQLLLPSIILEMKLISLNTLELEQFLKEKSEENPFIEFEENEQVLENYFPSLTQKTISSSDLLDKTFYEYDNIYDYFQNELNLLGIPENEIEIALLLVPYLSQNGMLKTKLDEISKILEIPFYILENGKVCLSSVDSKGYCSESLKEMILTQIWLSEDKDSLRLFDILFDYYDDIIHKNFSKLNKSGFSNDEIEKIINLMADLIVIPSSIKETKNQYIIPDAIINVKDDKISYKIIEPFKLSFYNYKIQNTDDEIKKLLNEAKSLNNALNIRKSIFENFMKYFVILQHDFFLKGENHIRPISQKEFAKKIEISESTLSRIVNNKYIDTPFGIYSLKYFFSHSYNKKKGVSSSVNSQSRIQVINAIKEIIKEEAKDNPYTDEAIVEILTKKGYHISRRTVSKYREIAGIPAKQLRKGVKKPIDTD